jgi:transposase
MMRVGLYRSVHVKTLRRQKLRMLLTHRKLLQSKAIAIENDLSGTSRNFGLKVGMVGQARFRPPLDAAISRVRGHVRCRVLPYRDLDDALGLSTMAVPWIL